MDLLDLLGGRNEVKDSENDTAPIELMSEVNQHLFTTYTLTHLLIFNYKYVYNYDLIVTFTYTTL